jgi:type VI secretion system protein ImpE
VKSKDLIKEGRLAEARAELVATLKDHPGDTASRTLLFQVLLFSGEWDKAERHLEMLADRNPEMASAVALYKNLLKCERERLEVASLRAMPSFLPSIPNYFESYGTILQSGSAGEVDDYFHEIESRVPLVTGTVNGMEFSGIRNTDDILAFALEVFAHDRYIWVPFESIREIIIPPPKTLLDMIWISASITTWSGLSMNGFLPALYPDSWKHADEQIRMGRMTDWSSRGGSLVRGAGQQVFVLGDQDVSILELREVHCNLTAQEGIQPTD